MTSSAIAFFQPEHNDTVWTLFLGSGPFFHSCWMVSFRVGSSTSNLSQYQELSDEGLWMRKDSGRAGGSARSQEPGNEEEAPERVEREASGPPLNQAVSSSEAHSGHTGWKGSRGYSQDQHFIKGMSLWWMYLQERSLCASHKIGDKVFSYLSLGYVLIMEDFPDGKWWIYAKSCHNLSRAF